MIDTKKQIIGNLLKMNDDTVIVKGLPADGFIQFALFTRPSIIFGEPIDEFEPIPLTEEWLDKKFGLPKREDSGTAEYSIRNDFEIYCYLDRAGYCVFYGENEHDLRDFFIIKCNSVHTFQNIYAILNPNEKLTIKDSI